MANFHVGTFYFVVHKTCEVTALVLTGTLAAALGNENQSSNFGTYFY